MKQICAYCGQDTYNVDWDYLVGHNHLACILIAEQTAEKMQIINWKKLNGEKLTVAGAQMYFTNCEENIKEYTCSIYDMDSKTKLFLLSFKKMVGCFDLEIVWPETGTKIKRVVRLNEIQKQNQFTNLITNELLKNNVFKTYCALLREIQNTKSSKTKLKPVRGNVNFNMPKSGSIKW